MSYAGLGQQLFNPSAVPGATGAQQTGWQVQTQAIYPDSDKAVAAGIMAMNVAQQQANQQIAAQALSPVPTLQRAVAMATTLGLPTCATQAEHDTAVNDCRMAGLRGLGALGAWTYPSGRFKGSDPCWVQALPVCPKPPVFTVKQYTAPVPTAVMPPPAYYQAPPVALLPTRLPPLLIGAKKPPAYVPPAPPVLVGAKKPPKAVAPILSTSRLALLPAQEAAPAKMGMGAILLILAAVGGTGYYLYKKQHKRAAAA